MDQHPTITHANHDDIREILAMIRELAEYEHASDQVLATEDSLARTLTFAPGPAAHTNPGYARTYLIRLPLSPSDPVDKPGRVAGMALYFYNYSTWRARPGIYLEDLFVRPEYRGRGYGRMLIRTLAKEVLMIGGGRMEWTCLRWNEPSLRFYRSLGAMDKDTWVGFRLEGQALEDLAAGTSKAVLEKQ